MNAGVADAVLSAARWLARVENSPRMHAVLPADSLPLMTHMHTHTYTLPGMHGDPESAMHATRGIQL